MFKLPQKIKDDIKKYRNSLEELLKGKINANRFKGVRVPWGIYSHRGGKVFMNRIRIPAGVLSFNQLEALSKVSSQYGDGVLHITTRQDIQVHRVKIEDTPGIMEFLKDYELSPRGGGGNTVRNIIGCPLAGVCSQEVFDIRGYAIALSEYLLRQDTSYNLPRKFKIAFTGCDKDCIGTGVADLGFSACIKNNLKGFRVLCGGGMGADSRVGFLLEDFIPEEELGYVVMAVKNVFFKKGNRKNKHHNRLRFLIYDDLGKEKFINEYRKELEELKKSEHIALRKINLEFPENGKEDILLPEQDDKNFKKFLEFNVEEQKQRGFFLVHLRIPRGDLYYKNALSLVELGKRYKLWELRTTPNQNISLVGVKAEYIFDIFEKLKSIFFEDFLYPETLLDIVACRGALTCNLGLCNSPGLAAVLEEVVKKNFLESNLLSLLNIKLNGCPNACGQHPLGEIAFSGMSRKVEGRTLPFYRVLLGGRKNSENTQLAQVVGYLAAKHLPSFLKEFFVEIQDKITQNNKFDFLMREGKEIARKLISKYSYVPPYEEDKSYYQDWGKDEDFSLDGLGQGECGAGVLDMIEGDLSLSEVIIKEIEKSLSASRMKEAIFCLCRSLLIVKGVDAKDAETAISAFKDKFISAGIASKKFEDIDKIYKEIDNQSPQERQQTLLFLKDFFNHIKSLYKSMDSSFNFPLLEEKEEKENKEPVKEKEHNFLDLKGTPCPINYVKAKLVLENLKTSDILEIILDEGEPIANVPKSLEADGHKILKIEKINRHYKIVVEKK